MVAGQVGGGLGPPRDLELADGVRRLTGAFERLSDNRHGDNDATATAAADRVWYATVKEAERDDRVHSQQAVGNLLPSLERLVPEVVQVVVRLACEV